MKFPTEKRALAVEKLIDVSLDMRTEARAILSKIAAAKARHAQELAALDDHFNIVCWHGVEANWSKQEIAAALAK